MGSAQNNKEQGDRGHRDGQGRPARLLTTQDASRRSVHVLLARLISVFIGALVGFLAAYVLSVYFIQPQQGLIADAQAIVDDAVNQLNDVEPRFNDARRELNAHERSLVDRGIIEEPAEASPALPLSGVNINPDEFADEPAADEAEDVQTEDPVALVSTDANADLKQYLQVKDEYHKLQRQRQRLTDQRDFWQGEIEKIQRDTNLLNLLGIAVVAVFGLLGYLLYPLWLLVLEKLSGQLSALTLGAGGRAPQATVGFFAGLIIAVVLMLALFSILGGSNSVLSLGWFRLLFGTFMVIVLGLVGSLTGITYFGPPRIDDPYVSLRQPAAPKVLDTSVIIDGRVHDISTTGFLSGKLVITNSVLRELQSLADSANERKRNKGRRGLELVRKMQDDPRISVQVFDDSDFNAQATSTDEQLIVVAQALSGKVVTNDYNLNRVAAIRNVRVININALANAVKTNHLPGDEIDIEVMDRGKQRGQGVGYLDDGTMVVVEDGEPYIGTTMTIRITSVSQTVQGRLLFGRVDLVEEGRGNAEH
jgi:uncharacterized protein YacL